MKLKHNYILKRLLSESKEQTELENTALELSHPDFMIENNWSFSIKDSMARSDQPPRKLISLAQYVLPPTVLTQRSLKLIDRPKLAICCALAAEVFYSQLKIITKSSLDNTSRIIPAVAKYFEYCWIEGFYDPKTITEESLDNLRTLLQEGGWAKALRISERLEEFLEGKTCVATSKNTYLINREVETTATALLKDIGSNINVKEARYILNALDNKKGIGSAKKIKPFDWHPPSKSSVAQYFTDVNWLAQLPQPHTFPKYPFPTISAAWKFKDGSRTQNVKVEHVAHLLSRSLLWIDQIGPLVCDAVDSIASDVIVRKDKGQKLLGAGIPKIIDDMAGKLKDIAPDIIVTNGDMARQKGFAIGLRDLIMAIQCACFVMIASMNARRKDEIIDRRIGLSRYSMSVEDGDLKLYQVYFYIEKTFNDYMPYYVNHGTYRAIRLLERLHDAYEKVDQRLTRKPHSSGCTKEASLFVYRRFNLQAGMSLGNVWFSLDSAIRQEKFALYSGTFDSNFRFRAHTLRRFYSILFYYRYENATLHSLMYQLGHRNLVSTFTYITDPSITREMNSIFSALSAARTDRKKAFDAEVQVLLKDLNEVGKEKLRENIRLILKGNASGGYAKYIRRLDAKIAVNARVDIEARTERIVKRVLAAGHWPDPKPHGDCMAGGLNSWKLAYCGDKQEKNLRQELASPRKCASCPFHHVSLGYLNHMKEDLHKLQIELKSDVLTILQKAAISREIKNLSIAIDLHNDRIVQ